MYCVLETVDGYKYCNGFAPYIVIFGKFVTDEPIADAHNDGGRSLVYAIVRTILYVLETLD